LTAHPAVVASLFFDRLVSILPSLPPFFRLDYSKLYVRTQVHGAEHCSVPFLFRLLIGAD